VHSGAFDEACRRGTRGIGPLSLSTDDHCLWLSELDIDLLFLHAGELALELIGLARLANVKLRLPAATALARTRVVIEVVKEPQEGSEGNVRVVKVASEESHCACLVGSWLDSDKLEIPKGDSKKF